MSTVTQGATFEENNAQITVKPLPTVKANSQQMAQLFQNLIANALKFRGEATPSVVIQATPKMTIGCSVSKIMV
ncbi:hypothetical protein [Allocoleopsis sp.]|uniref:hypothetical protein n=1 Tax=Allocoleopsis sp. TaxID=3088169 RepID=UPI002FCE9D95